MSLVKQALIHVVLVRIMFSEYENKVIEARNSIKRYELLIENENKCSNKNEELITAYQYTLDGLERQLHNYNKDKG